MVLEQTTIYYYSAPAWSHGSSVCLDDDSDLYRLKMALEFKCSLFIKKLKDGETVYLKQDGERFQQAQTIKLNTNTDYEVRLNIRPVLALRNILIHEERYALEKEQTNKENEDDSSTYCIKLNTSRFELSKRGKRRDIPFVLEFERGMYLKINLQCKLYSETETEHCHWGQPLNTLLLECRVPEGQNFVEVQKEKYL
ncbi:hypothetical protein CHS0354_024243 [Potamilus streckersoni]|uniref:CB1 cannabinoid receptor-interacting protein 1 n=1 Tax=Potamilus streckersoni TaxID=2493646 RepID=A0AAE0SB91_9BIVA|nr:hypothetical protein CHS0354_024243 [Potamilus streckersoni]